MEEGDPMLKKNTIVYNNGSVKQNAKVSLSSVPSQESKEYTGYLCWKKEKEARGLQVNFIDFEKQEI